MKTFSQYTMELDNLQKWEQTQLLDGVSEDRNNERQYDGHGSFTLDREAETVSKMADSIISQIQTMGNIAIHCLDCMDDGSIRMNYSLQH